MLPFPLRVTHLAEKRAPLGNPGGPKGQQPGDVLYAGRVGRQTSDRVSYGWRSRVTNLPEGSSRRRAASPEPVVRLATNPRVRG